MKKSLLFVFAALLSQLSYSQIVTTPNDTVIANVTQTDEFDVAAAHVYIVNTSSTSKTYTWFLKDYQAPSTWGVQLCDNNNCYDLLLFAGPHESLPVAAGDTMDMKMQFASYCIQGTGVSNVVIYETGDSANTSTNLNYTVNLTAACPSAIGTTPPSIQPKIYPSPFSNSFTVSDAAAVGNRTYAVYDLKGVLINTSARNLNGGATEIYMSNAPAGVYVLKTLDENGAAIHAQQLLKSE